MSDKQKLTPDDVAAELVVKKRFVYQLIATGDLPAVRIGKSRLLRVEREALDDFLAQRRVQPAVSHQPTVITKGRRRVGPRTWGKASERYA